MQWLSDQLNAIANWLQSYLLYVPKWCWQHLLEAIQAVIAAIPVPQAFTDFSSFASAIPSGVLWFLGIMQFQYGVTVIVGAMAARFLLKLIPFLSF